MGESPDSINSYCLKDMCGAAGYMGESSAVEPRSDNDQPAVDLVGNDLQYDVTSIS